MPKRSRKHTAKDHDRELLVSHEEEREPERKKSSKNSVTKVRGKLFRPTWLFLLALGITGYVAGPQLMQRLPDLTGRPEYQLQVENLHIRQIPNWLPPDLVTQVAELENWSEKPISLLDDSCCERIATAFQRHPWVKHVDRVQLRSGARVELQITFRKPVAMVEAGRGQYFPIDADAIVLPPSDFSRADINRYPTILDPATLPQGPAGSYWGDLMVLGAARLAERFQEPHDETQTHWQHLNLAAIELPQRTTAEQNIEEIQFRVLTKDGSRIVWGRAPGTNHPGELTAEQKIGRLTQYLADYGRFRPAQGPLEIDIRHWQEITQRRISGLESAPRR